MALLFYKESKSNQKKNLAGGRGRGGGRVSDIESEKFFISLFFF